LNTFLNLRQLCRLLDCGKSTIYRWIKSGDLPPPVKRGQASFWDAAALARAVGASTRIRLPAAALSELIRRKG